MNGEQFYEEFKAALQYLGLRWADMKLMKVWVEADCLNFSYDNKTLHVPIQKEKP